MYLDLYDLQMKKENLKDCREINVKTVFLFVVVVHLFIFIFKKFSCEGFYISSLNYNFPSQGINIA